MLQNPFQILQNQRVFLPRIVQIDLRIHIFDVDDVAVHDGIHLLDDFEGHVEASLHHDLPLRAAKRSKFLDELLLQQGFSPTKGDATMRSQKIELVNLDLLEEHFRGVVATFVHIPRGLVEAILATQGAAVERHQRGDALAVSGQAVTVESEYLCCGHSMYFGFPDSSM